MFKRKVPVAVLSDSICCPHACPDTALRNHWILETLRVEMVKNGLEYVSCTIKICIALLPLGFWHGWSSDENMKADWHKGKHLRQSEDLCKTNVQSFKPVISRLLPLRSWQDDRALRYDSPAWRLHQGWRIRFGYFQQDSHWVHLVIGRLNLCQLNQGDPEGPDVSLVVIWTVLGRLAHHHLWSHPGRKDGLTLKEFMHVYCILHMKVI